MNILTSFDTNDFLKVLGIFTAFVVSMAVIVISLRYAFKIKDYIYRKMLHMIAVTAIFPLVFTTDNPLSPIGVIVLYLAVIYFALRAAEKLPFFDSLFVQKKPHEIVKSFLGLFAMFGVLIIITWAVPGEEYKYLSVISVMAWGPGDAMAAIVGLNYGRHHLTGRFIEGTKSGEGTLAMAVTSFVCVFLSYILFTDCTSGQILAYSLILSIVSAFTELYTKGGWDTVSVPAMALIMQVIFLYI